MEIEEDVWFEHVNIENGSSETNWNSLITMVAGINNQLSSISKQINAIDSRLKKFEEQQEETSSVIENEVEELKSQIPTVKSVLPTVEIDPVAPPLTSLLKPVQCKEELDELEAKAKDEQFRDEIVQAVGRIHGHDRKGEGDTVCYQIVDYFFDRKFLTECSWYGRMSQRTKNGPGKRKIGLIGYGSTMKLFHACVHLSDETFTQTQSIKFIRRCLRYSATRAKAKMVIKPAARRRNPKKVETNGNLAVNAVVENQLRHLQTDARRK
ncbi:uncharacterized protein LOC125950002 [Anopheles darlingi]|uniref:uncharacterized protein LOC125950002 n=1 Tax=Anopheles darlingi TaxID=43151 RepID=UPI0021005E3C|nr:uncharacterized protein LOC125950002 [Anopheles darlingi]